MSSRGQTPRLSMISGPCVITGGIFNIHSTPGDGRKSPFDILRDAVSHTAFHNSGALFDRPKCHPNTRLAVLSKIRNWARRADKETWDRYIMWLTGAAGAGKSAIAQSFIKSCFKGLVIASFFFNRSDGTRNHAGSFIATLVYQIYQAVPAVQREILSVIGEDPLILTKDLDHQFTHLVARPLYNACYSGTSSTLGSWRVVVIDGLDECLNRNAQRQILETISQGIQEYDLPILFLIASRPEHEINVVFNRQEMNGMYKRLYLDDTFHPDDDIRVFLKDSFEEIRRTHPFKSRILMVWPTPESVESIVRKSSGQFIYAATVVGYVKSIRHQPHQQLEKILNLRPLQGDMPFAQLDELYTMILSGAADIERVLFAISVYSLGVEQDQKIDLPHYMSLDREEIEILFCDLGALVSVEWDDENKKTSLKVLHASLHDFLLDPMRSKDYYINLDAYRTKHIITILQYITPKFGESDDPDLKDQLDFEEMKWHLFSTQIFFEENCANCEITADIVRQAFNFPLAQTLNHEWGLWRINVIRFLCFDFLPFIRRMARPNAQYSFIDSHTQDTFDGFFLSNMARYYDCDNFIASICLTYHLGHVEYVPGCIESEGSSTTDILINSVFEPSTDMAYIPLLLDEIDLSKIGTDKDRYRQCLLGFLQDPDRSGKYAIGPHTYTKATSFFMEKLSRWYPESKGWWTLDEKESVFSAKITFHDNIWTLNKSGVAIDVETFLFLGYIIFFLPKCSKSPELLEHCKQQSFLTQDLITSYPERTALVRRAMQDYLERVGTEFPLECAEDWDD